MDMRQREQAGSRRRCGKELKSGNATTLVVPKSSIAPRKAEGYTK